MSQYFPKLYEPFGGDINVRVELSYYVTKTDIKNILHVDNSSSALKSNLTILKTEVDKLDIEKFVPVSINLSKLSHVVKNNVVKKTVYNKLVAKVNNIDTSGLASKFKCDRDNQKCKIKFLILVVLLKRQITTKIKIAIIIITIIISK